VVSTDSGTRLPSATLQQRLVPIWLFYGDLPEEGLRGVHRADRRQHRTYPVEVHPGPVQVDVDIRANVLFTVPTIYQALLEAPVALAHGLGCGTGA
jgi:hypothetical protein